MTKKQKINDRVWKCDGYGVSESLSSFIETLKEKLALVPEGYEAKIEIDSHMEYDSSYVDIEVYYTREETDQEEQERVSKENIYKNQRIAEAKKLLGIT